MLRAAASAVVLLAIAPPAASVDGLWRTPNPGGVVRILQCADQLCGDGYDPARPELQGPQILSGFSGGPLVWLKGRIIDPRTHHAYAGRLRLRDPSSLEVTGCLAPALCGRQVWTRMFP